MSDPMTSAKPREFTCKHCEGKIQIPWNLPPTTGPCPHCAGVITSPECEEPESDAAQVTTDTSDVTPPIAVVLPASTPPPIISQPPPYQKTPPILIPAAIETNSPADKIVEPKHEKAKNDAVPKAEKSKRSRWIFTLVVIFLLLATIGFAIIYALKEMSTQVAQPMGKASNRKPTVDEAHYIQSGWQKEAYQLLKDYMAATDTPNKLRFVLRSSELSSKIHEFYGGSVIVDSDTPAEAFAISELPEEDRKRGLFMMTYEQPPQFEMAEFFRPLASLEVQYGVDKADLLLSTLARAKNFAMEPLRVHAFFKKTPEGLKLDWEIFAQTKYRTLRNFVELPEVGQSATFRVLIVEDVPEKGKAVVGHRAYRIADPANTDDTVRINVKIDSEIGRALSLINWRGTKENRPITRTATVELKWTGESAAPELMMSRFICWEFLGLGGQETSATAFNK